MCIATIRYKAYRLFKRLTLGSRFGGPLGGNVCRTLEECGEFMIFHTIHPFPPS